MGRELICFRGRGPPRSGCPARRKGPPEEEREAQESEGRSRSPKRGAVLSSGERREVQAEGERLKALRTRGRSRRRPQVGNFPTQETVKLQY